jgi:3-methyladenine DNA glycosylase/8-oxoguanine DNA glycosylase
LARTVGAAHLGAGDPTVAIAGGEVWRTTTTPDGPATVCLSGTPGLVMAEVWGPGRRWALARAAGMAGLEDDPTGFDPSPDPVVADLARRRPGLRLGRTGRVMDALVPAVLGQKVTGLESRRSWRAVVLAYGELAPGPRARVPRGLRTPPEPDTLRAGGYAAFHRFGVERRRAETILRACARASSLERLADAHRNEPGELTRKLETLPGIGPWTSALVAGTALGDADAVPVGDDNLPHHVAWALVGERRASDDRMLELLAPFAGHRARVLRLLAATPSPPRRAPRARVRSWATW